MLGSPKERVRHALGAGTWSARDARNMAERATNATARMGRPMYPRMVSRVKSPAAAMSAFEKGAWAERSLEARRPKTTTSGARKMRIGLQKKIESG